jgi:hypothetical protein
MTTVGTDKAPRKKVRQVDLNHFTGTEKWHRRSLFSWAPLVTDGVLYVLETGQCYWLFDKIVALQLEIDKSKLSDDRQFWSLEQDKDHSAILKLDDGNGEIIYTEDIAFTDFDFSELDGRKIKFYIMDNVMLLPTEY